MDNSEKDFLKQHFDNILKKRNFITKLKTSDGTEYALFENGDICQIMEDNTLKKVNDIIDKDEKLKKRILGRFNDSRNIDIVRTDTSKSKGEADSKVPEI